MGNIKHEDGKLHLNTSPAFGSHLNLHSGSIILVKTDAGIVVTYGREHCLPRGYRWTQEQGTKGNACREKNESQMEKDKVLFHVKCGFHVYMYMLMCAVQHLSRSIQQDRRSE